MGETLIIVNQIHVFTQIFAKLLGNFSSKGMAHVPLSITSYSTKIYDTKSGGACSDFDHLYLRNF